MYPIVLHRQINQDGLEKIIRYIQYDSFMSSKQLHAYLTHASVKRKKCLNHILNQLSKVI